MKDVRILPALSSRTPPSRAQRAQIRDLHHNARFCIREEWWSARVRVQEGQFETPPAAGSVVVAAPERHLVQSRGRVVCGFPGASACGNVVLWGMSKTTRIEHRGVARTFGRS